MTSFLNLKKITALLVCIPLIFFNTSPVFAKTVVKPKPAPLPHYTRLFYYTGGPKAQKAFTTHPSSIDIFAPQTYEVTINGDLVGSVNPEMLAFAHAHAIKVVPLLTNTGFGERGYQSILNDQNKQTALINALVTAAKDNGYAGWQFDFEQMDASYRDSFSAFVQRTYTVMKMNSLSLSVAVIAKISDDPNEYPAGLWQKLIGVYDYDRLAQNTDFLSIMSYDDPYSKGPVAQYPWLEKVITYSLLHIPKEKISLGIPFYYWQWDATTGKRIGIGGRTGIEKITAKHKVAFHYDPIMQAPYFVYKEKGADRIVWYENQKSVAAKVALVRKYGLGGTSAWALGLELPTVYAAFKE